MAAKIFYFQGATESCWGCRTAANWRINQNAQKAKEALADTSLGPVGAASVEYDAILPQLSQVFKCATIKGFDSERKILGLVIECLPCEYLWRFLW